MSLLNIKQKKEENFFKNNFKSKKEPEYSNIQPDIKKKNEISNMSSLIIGEKVVILGTIKADNLVTIQGTVDGDIECKYIEVKKTGNIKGKILTENATIEGQIDGEININSVLHIKSNGNVNGKISYSKIQIDEGGTLQGEIKSEKLKEASKLTENVEWKAL